jgi:hypothetical protein
MTPARTWGMPSIDWDSYARISGNLRFRETQHVPALTIPDIASDTDFKGLNAESILKFRVATKTEIFRFFAPHFP